MMYSSRPQPTLYNLKPSSFAQYDVCCGNADVVEGDVSVAVGSIIVTKNGEHASKVEGTDYGATGEYHYPGGSLCSETLKGCERTMYIQ